MTKPHGVRGAVKLRLHNPDSDALSDLGRLHLETSSGERLRIEGIVAHSAGSPVARVEGVASMEDAERLRGARLLLERDAIALDDDEYLYQDLVGCSVRDGERVLGVVSDVFSAGASDVLVVRGDDGERMIPLVEPWVAKVDLEARTIEVHGAAEAFEPTAAG
ncbi:MAG: 16S rRNA processing protein RimM [Myxococcales bacterium]|nr:16S rRNA processing protein RimM [Myxococcales bacterium]